MAQDNGPNNDASDNHRTANRSAKRTVRRVVKSAPQRPRVTLGRPDTAGGTPSKVTRRSVGNKGVGGKPKAKSQQSALKRTTRAGIVGISSSSSQMARRSRSAAKNAAEATQTTFHRARAVRLPLIPQLLASAIAGLLTGLFTVLIGWGFMALFNTLRGTSTGGSQWGGIAVAFMLVFAFVVGELLMRQLGVRRARLTSFTGICGALALILAFAIELLNGAWIWLIVPALSALSFAVMHKVLASADQYETD